MIIDINEDIQHKVSETICIKCKYRWISVRPQITLLKELVCPNCSSQGYVIETGEIVK